MSQQLRAVETRTRILDAALDCFTGAGYDATSVAAICTRAGVSKGAFYHHFPTKQAVFVALLDRWLTGLDTAIQATQGGGMTASQRLAHLGGMVQQLLISARGHLPMFLEFWRQAARDPEVWQKTIAPYRQFRAAFAALVSDGIADGDLRSVDPELAAHVLVSLGVGLLLQGVLDPAGDDNGRPAEQAVRLLLDGLAHR